MKEFFIAAGILVTVLGLFAIALLSFVFIYVRVLGYPLTLIYQKDEEEESDETDDTDTDL